MKNGPFEKRRVQEQFGLRFETLRARMVELFRVEVESMGEKQGVLTNTGCLLTTLTYMISKRYRLVRDTAPPPLPHILYFKLK